MTLKLVQVLLTDEQAELVAAALRDAGYALTTEADRPRADDVPHEEWQEAVEIMQADIAAVGRLELLFQDASENPLKYKPDPKNAIVRSIVKAAKGPAQMPSRRKSRADRHQRRKAERAFFRRNRKMIEGYNAAMATQREEEAEYAAMLAEVEERVKDQPRFTITDGFGHTIMAGVPAEFVLNEEGEAPLTLGTKPRLIVPGVSE